MRFLPALTLVLGCHVFEPPAEQAPPPDVTLTRVSLSQWNAGKLEAKATLDTLAYQRATARAEGAGVTALPMEGTEPAGRLVAAISTALVREGRIDLEGGVVWHGREGDVARTEACEADLKTGHVTGAGPLTLEGEGYAVTGQSFDAELRGERRLNLKGGVKGHSDTGVR